MPDKKRLSSADKSVSRRSEKRSRAALPVAMAGSILNRSRVKGTRVPKMEAKITTANKESDTDTVVAILSRKNQL